MAPKSERDLEAAAGRVMEAVGRCLIVYQRIEICLKYLLPHIEGPGDLPGEGLAQWRALLDSKTTLGPLMERLWESARTSDPEAFRKYVGEVLTHRNELIHHFCQLPFGRMNSVGECEAALAHVNRKIDFARPLYLGLHEMMSQFRGVLMELKLLKEVG